MRTTLLPWAAAAAAVVALLPATASADPLAPPRHHRSYASHGELPGALSAPRGITAVGSSTAVADAGNDRISIFDRTGRHLRDLTGLRQPHDVAATPRGDLVVADTKNNRVRVFSPDGSERLSFGGAGLDDGELLLPTGVAVTADGSIVVSDHANHRVQMFDRHGHWQLSIPDVQWPRGIEVHDEQILVATAQRVAVFGLDGEPVRSHELGWEPWDVAVDGAGRTYVVDAAARRIEVIGSTGRRLTRFGEPGARPDQFGGAPRGVALTADGTIHTVDSSGRVLVWRFHRCAGQIATHVGTAGDDTIVGTPGRDVVVALHGDDEVRGRGGSDLVCAGAGDDVVRGGGGRDLVRGGAGHDLLGGGEGIDELRGGRGDDRVRGGDRDDELRGGRGDDLLHGGRGTDDCRGGRGADVLRACEVPAHA